MVWTRKKRQSSKRLLNQLHDFKPDVFFDDPVNSGQQNVIVNDGTVEPEFTAYISGSNSTANENTVNVQALERCFNERVDREMDSIVDMVVDTDAVLTALDNIITPRIELAIRSKNASSRRDTASVVVS